MCVFFAGPAFLGFPLDDVLQPTATRHSHRRDGVATSACHDGQVVRQEFISDVGFVNGDRPGTVLAHHLFIGPGGEPWRALLRAYVIQSCAYTAPSGCFEDPECDREQCGSALSSHASLLSVELAPFGASAATVVVSFDSSIGSTRTVPNLDAFFANDVLHVSLTGDIVRVMHVTLEE